MIIRNLTPGSITTQHSGAVSAGTDGAMVGLNEIDMLGYTGLRIIFCIGTVTSTGILTTRVKASNTSGTYGSGTVDRIGSDLATDADDDGGKLIIHEFTELAERYVKPYYQRTTANVVINSVIVERFNPAQAPITQSQTNVAASQVLCNPTPSTT